MSLVGEVYGSFAVDAVPTDNLMALHGVAVAAAVAAGVDLSSFGHIAAGYDYASLYRWTGTYDWVFSGQASAGCTTVTVGGRAQTASQVTFWNGMPHPSTPPWGDNPLYELIGHELGHGLGMLHSSSQIDSGETLGRWTPLSAGAEYGDLVSLMGRGVGHVASPHKKFLGWLVDADVHTVTDPGEFTLNSLYSSEPGARAIRLRRYRTYGEPIWLEYRPRGGEISPFEPEPEPLYDSSDGLMFYVTTDYQPSRVYVLNANAPSAHKTFAKRSAAENNVGLQPGVTWSDRYSGLTVTYTESSPGAIRVKIEWAQPCEADRALNDEAIPAEGAIWQRGIGPGQDCNQSAATLQPWAAAPTRLRTARSDRLQTSIEPNRREYARPVSLFTGGRTITKWQAAHDGSTLPLDVDAYGGALQKGTERLVRLVLPYDFDFTFLRSIDVALGPDPGSSKCVFSVNPDEPPESPLDLPHCRIRTTHAFQNLLTDLGVSARRSLVLIYLTVLGDIPEGELPVHVRLMLRDGSDGDWIPAGRFRVSARGSCSPMLSSSVRYALPSGESEPVQFIRADNCADVPIRIEADWLRLASRGADTLSFSVDPLTSGEPRQAWIHWGDASILMRQGDSAHLTQFPQAKVFPASLSVDPGKTVTPVWVGSASATIPPVSNPNSWVTISRAAATLPDEFVARQVCAGANCFDTTSEAYFLVEVQPNPTGADRSAVIAIGDTRLRIHQWARPRAGRESR